MSAFGEELRSLLSLQRNDNSLIRGPSPAAVHVLTPAETQLQAWPPEGHTPYA